MTFFLPGIVVWLPAFQLNQAEKTAGHVRLILTGTVDKSSHGHLRGQRHHVSLRKSRNLYIKRFLSWQRRRQAGTRLPSLDCWLLLMLATWNKVVLVNWDVSRPSITPREGNEPLDGMQWHTDTCFVASQVVADSGWRPGGKNTVERNKSGASQRIIFNLSWTIASLFIHIVSWFPGAFQEPV